MMRTLVVLAMLFGLTAPVHAIDWGSDDTLEDAQALIERENWPGAVAMLKTIVADDPDNPDALNLLAFVLRKSGDLRNAEGLYGRALDLDPGHIGANAYLGALYAETDRRALAEEKLTLVHKLCGLDCESAVELAALLAGP